jgi:hypothetical protein
MVVLHGHPGMILNKRRKISTTGHGGILTGSIVRRSAGYSAYTILKRQRKGTLTC